MRLQLDILLSERYPKIFAERQGSPMTTAMGRGFECGDGWFDLIDELCRDLQAEADSGRIPQPVAQQVKEKIGSLRFRFFPLYEFSKDLLETARKKSLEICEVCGETGRLRCAPSFGYRTTCDSHAREGDSIAMNWKDW